MKGTLHFPSSDVCGARTATGLSSGDVLMRCLCSAACGGEHVQEQGDVGNHEAASAPPGAVPGVLTAQLRESSSSSGRRGWDPRRNRGTGDESLFSCSCKTGRLANFMEAFLTGLVVTWKRVHAVWLPRPVSGPVGRLRGVGDGGTGTGAEGEPAPWTPLRLQSETPRAQGGRVPSATLWVPEAARPARGSAAPHRLPAPAWGMPRGSRAQTQCP